eukprot:TRINITY_DN19033_c0_g1_i1.p1 TRINITY_DN19033_c0_g1~~TRINITY_DN19033_c0_g1_i1.p1  ORF type:complete len:752 (+),score=95.90 TRINITY_DN19033_c0_g1_i1:76-2331(+)
MCVQWTWMISGFLSDSDTELDITRKKTMLAMLFVNMIFSIIIVYEDGFKPGLYHTANAVVFVIESIAIVKWRITKVVTINEITFLVAVLVTGLLCVDVTLASEWRHRVWPIVALQLDLCLVCLMPSYVPNMVIGIVIFYVLLDSVEGVTRFGLYDITGGEKMKLIRQCINVTQEELDKSPCPYDIGVVGGPSMAYMIVLLFDYYITRRFAVRLHDQTRTLELSVSQAESVVTDLVRFDLEKARETINRGEITALSEVLLRLLVNLDSYRPYIPDSLFDVCNDHHASIDATKPPTEFAAVLFTDLKSSTAIWEASPDAMKKALKIHNDVIRKCIKEMFGYEVKTIGDSFMVAFHTLNEACAFAMEVQEQLASTIWPQDLLLPRFFHENGWTGLMVRIGIHYGEVATEVGVSGRMDYFGRTVNRAARLEGACKPGGVAVDSSLAPQVNPHPGWRHKQMSVELKGIDNNPIDITVFTRNYTPSVTPSIASTSSFQTTTIASRSSVSGPSEPIDLKKQLSRRLSSTVCTTRLLQSTVDDAFESQMNSALARFISCVERTDGSVLTVMSSSMTVGWNTAKSCANHSQNGLRYTSLLYAAFPSECVNMGLTGGPVHCGRVGTKEQRFVTVYGPSVELSALLCQGSIDVGATVLCAKCPILPVMRPIDRWSNIIIYQVRVESLREYFTLSRASDNFVLSDTNWGWSTMYTEAFEKSDLELIDTEKDTDLVLLNVCDMIKTGRSLRVAFNSTQVLPTHD